MKKGLKQQFNAIIELDEDGFYVASVPALPGCHTQAKTLEQLRDRLREVIELCLDHAKEDPAYRKLVKELSYNPKFIALESVQV